MMEVKFTCRQWLFKKCDGDSFPGANLGYPFTNVRSRLGRSINGGLECLLDGSPEASEKVKKDAFFYDVNNGVAKSWARTLVLSSY